MYSHPNNGSGKSTRYTDAESIDLPFNGVDSRRINLLRRSNFGRSNEYFITSYEEWLHVRNKSISELKKLKEDIGSEQQNFDTVKLCCKKGSAYGKETKLVATSENVEFFGNLTSLISDVIGGVTTLAEAVNVNKALSTFKEIMQKDAEVTKRFFTVQFPVYCKIAQHYRGFREYTGKTFSDTCSSISDTLGMDQVSKNPSLLSLCDHFDQNISIDVLHEVKEAVNEYTEINPAVVDTVSAVGRCFLGVVETCKKSSTDTGSNIVSRGKRMVYRSLLHEDYKEIESLECKIACGSSSKIAEQIEAALAILEQEKKEVNLIIDEIIRKT